jgi:hypothetical protein
MIWLGIPASNLGACNKSQDRRMHEQHENLRASSVMSVRFNQKALP